MNHDKQSNMERLLRGEGLFPTPREQAMSQMTHNRTQTPYQQFQQEYPALDAYGRKVASGEMFKENMQRLAQDMENTQQLAFGRGDPTKGNILDYLGFGAITAYHGSPYKFDRFSLDKIGTGEGAQAYGHGLYFAENPKTAKAYLPKSSENILESEPSHKIIADGREVQGINNILSIKARGLKKTKPENIKKSIVKSINEELNDWKLMYEKGAPGLGLAPKSKRASDEINRLNSALKRITDSSEVKFDYDSGSSLYKVDIPDEYADNFLDWDAPLKDQPESVQKALMSDIRDLHLDSSSGEAIYDAIKTINEYDPSEASRYLNSLGIKGIKYFDQGSRQVGQGTRNFVVFDDDIVKILERDGESLTPTFDKLMEQSY